MSELEDVVEKVQKLLSLGRHNTSQAEAESAMAKAQELLARHNLDMAAVEGLAAGSARREKASHAGGMYLYQRELWSAVARLNFCLHFRRHERVEVRGRPRWEGDPGRLRVTWRNQHMIVGRTVNVRATIAQGTYLESVADRLCRERLEVRSGTGETPGHLNSQFFTSWAVAFREGIADEVILKLDQRRRRVEKDEAARERAAARAREAAADGASTATALTLSVYKSKEHDANIDFMWGAGTAAEWAAERVARAAERRAEADRLTRLAQEDPKAHAAEERKREAAERRSWGRSPPARRVNAGGYHAGRTAGKEVGIDPQVERDSRRLT